MFDKIKNPAIISAVISSSMMEMTDFMNSIVSVQPMSKSLSETFYIDFVCGTKTEAEDLYKNPFVWNKKYRTNQNTLAYLQSDGYTLYDTTVDDIKKYIFQVSNGNVSTKQCDEFVKNWKISKKSKVCLARSSEGSWCALAGREYIIIYNPRGEIRYIYCWKMS